jgi:hypothetical protein
MQKETWKPLRNYYGYEVSNFARVRDPKNEILQPCFEGEKLTFTVSKNNRDVRGFLTVHGFTEFKQNKAPKFGPPRKKINQIDLSTGRTLKTFESLREASRFTGLVPSVLSKACNKEGKTAGGYAWKFAEMDI